MTVEELYGDIIDLEHPTSSRHPRMSREARAAQFAAFAALTGFDDLIEQTAQISAISRSGELEEEEF